jgi:hypothetical protein
MEEPVPVDVVVVLVPPVAGDVASGLNLGSGFAFCCCAC